MKKKNTTQSAFYNLRILTGLIPVAALVFLAFFAAANPPTRVEADRAGGVTRQALMRVTPQGIIQSTHLGNQKHRRRRIE